MATTNNITTSYSGLDAKKWVSASLLMANSIENGIVTALPNLQGNKHIMHKLSINDIVKNATCDFDPTSTITQTERILTLEEFQVNLQLCKKDYYSTWQSYEMGASAHSVLPKSFADYMLAYVANKTAAWNEVKIWSGVNANAGEYDGFETLLAADADLPSANEVSGTTITASNVTTELGKILDAVPSAVYGQENLKLIVSKNIMKAYIRALGGFGSSGLGANGYGAQGSMWYNGQALNFEGVDLVMAQGMSANKAICTTSDNLFFGTKLLSDLNEVKLIDTSETLGDQNVRVVMRFVAGVQYASIEDIVTYGITNNAN